MKRLVRRLAWVAVALTAVALMFGVTLRLLEPPPGPAEAKARRIRPGLTRADAEAILGGAGERLLAMDASGKSCVDHSSHWYIWRSLEGVTAVRFASSDGPGDLIGEVSFSAAPKCGDLVFTEDPKDENASTLQRIRSLLGW
jgi:hypothetical protein